MGLVCLDGKCDCLSGVLECIHIPLYELFVSFDDNGQSMEDYGAGRSSNSM